MFWQGVKEDEPKINYTHQIVLNETEFTNKYKFKLDLEENNPYLRLSPIEKIGYSPLTPNISIKILRSPDHAVFWCELVPSVIN